MASEEIIVGVVRPEFLEFERLVDSAYKQIDWCSTDYRLTIIEMSRVWSLVDEFELRRLPGVGMTFKWEVYIIKKAQALRRVISDSMAFYVNNISR
jgi:hypothetical protein